MKIKNLAVTMLLVVAMGTNAFAAEPNQQMTVQIGENTIDVTEAAINYGVNPLELKQTVEAELQEEKFSPFSDLVTSKPNLESGTEVEYSKTRISEEGNTKVIKYNQDSTAYTAASGAQTASQKTPTIGMCAMKTGVTTKTGSTSKTIIRLGQTIYLNKVINVNGTNCSYLKVEDRGSGSNRTDYWIDIYWGKSTNANNTSAYNYGIKKVTYYYYY